jgi:hypothetical protein
VKSRWVRVDRLGLLRRMEDSGLRLRLLRLLASRRDVDVKGLKIGNWSFVILSNEVTTLMGMDVQGRGLRMLRIEQTAGCREEEWRESLN